MSGPTAPSLANRICTPPGTSGSAKGSPNSLVMAGLLAATFSTTVMWVAEVGMMWHRGNALDAPWYNEKRFRVEIGQNVPAVPRLSSKSENVLVSDQSRAFFGLSERRRVSSQTRHPCLLACD